MRRVLDQVTLGCEEYAGTGGCEMSEDAGLGGCKG